MNIELSKKKLIIMLLIFPHMKPGYFDRVNSLDYLFNGWRILSLGIIILLCIYHRQKITIVSTLIIGFWAYIAILTYLNN